MTLRLGTRASQLAVTQSEHVAELLRASGHDVELVRIRTGGDVERGSLTKLGSLGVFAAELRAAILDGRCDFAVHSLKDLPTAEVPGLVVAAVPAREDPHDALCAGGRTLAELPSGARVGTGSPRRVAQLRRLRPDLTFVDLRGNVGTRLARVTDGDLDAVVLAAAGLRRLGMTDAIDDFLPILPAPGQGALALECRADDEAVLAVLRSLDDADAHLATAQERAVLAGLGGGCAAPIGVLATCGRLSSGVFALDGTLAVLDERPLTHASAEEAVDHLLAQGAATVTDLGQSRPSRLAELHDDASLWRGEGAIVGVQVLLPRSQCPLADDLRAAGAEVTCCPVQELVPLSFDSLPATNWVAITSARTVTALEAQGVRLPATAKIAAVGQATARALEEAGYRVTLTPEGPSSGKALAAAFPNGPGTVLIPGSALAASTLPDALSAKGWQVQRIPVYTMRPVAPSPAAKQAWDAGQFDVVVITAGSVAQALSEQLGWREDVQVVSFGSPSSAWLTRHGVSVAARAKTQDAAGLLAAIQEATR